MHACMQVGRGGGDLSLLSPSLPESLEHALHPSAWLEQSRIASAKSRRRDCYRPTEYYAQSMKCNQLETLAIFDT